MYVDVCLCVLMCVRTCLQLLGLFDVGWCVYVSVHVFVSCVYFMSVRLYIITFHYVDAIGMFINKNA